jgi:SAM-dependent methyltransferase
MSGTADDRWFDGDAYYQYVGRWSALIASEFIDWLSVPDSSRWLDVGCGAGDLTRIILKRTSPEAVRGVDLSPEYVAFASERIDDERASFRTADATTLEDDDDDSYDAIVSGLVMNFVPDPGLAVMSMSRVAQSGGTVAAYVWDYAGKMELMRYFWDAVVELFPEAAGLDEGVRFPICKPEALSELWQSAGLYEVETRAIDVPTSFQNFDDYWTPFLGGQGPAPGFVATLTESDRSALKNLIGSRVPINADGSINLIARAWAVKGRVE